MLQQVSHYEIKELLGQGGMGEVYRANDPKLFGEVAVKILRFAEPSPFLSQEELKKEQEKQKQALERFEHEAKVVARLQHYAIVPVYDFGRVQVGKEEYSFMMMRLMKGGSLEERLQAGALPLEEVGRIIEWLAPALDKVHQKKIVPRDLKPANILFDEDGKPYLADFGIAKLLEAQGLLSEFKAKTLTQTRAALGTPAYMSPEQTYSNAELDGRSDIYALGAILYEMLTSKPPYHQARDASEVMSCHRLEPVPRLDELRTDLGGAWQAVIDKAMAKQPDERYATASELVAALGALISPPPPPPLGIGSERICPKDGMVQLYVPAGKFLMGSRKDDPDALDREKPQHEVYLDAYWIDKTPVTNAMFAKFVAETGYVTEAEKAKQEGFKILRRFRSRWQNKAGSDRENHPVVYVSWNDAVAYAKWAERRLPTEAEWEKAAGGTDERQYPWGNEPPTSLRSKLCNFDMNVKDTTPVGNYPAGASPYGALDMAGNIWEWCNDSLDFKYYSSSPKDNPRGAKSIETKVLRGGSWFDAAPSARVRFRAGSDANSRDNLWGFRCAGSPS